MIDADMLSPLAGEMAAKQPEGVIAAARDVLIGSSPSGATPPGRFAATFPSRAGLSHMELPPPLTPPHKGEGDRLALRQAQSPAISRCTTAAKSPSPMWGGVRGGGAGRAAVAEIRYAATLPSRGRD